MIRFLFLIGLFLTNLFAQDTLSIYLDKVPKNTLGFTYFIDSKPETTAQTILYCDTLQKAEKLNLGIINTPIWTKLYLKNEANTTQNFVFFNERAGTNEIVVFIFKNNNLLKKHILGDMNPQNSREFLNRYSAFLLQMAPKEELVIVTKLVNNGVYNIGWQIAKPEDFFKIEQQVSLIFGALGGFLFFYMMFNVILYWISKEKGYLLLVGVVVSIFFYSFSVHGYLYSFDIGLQLHLIGAFAWLSPLLTVIFLLLFPYYFFNVPQKYPKISKLILGVIIVFGFLFFSTIYMLYVDSSLFINYKYVSLLYMLNPLMMLLLALYLLFKKEEFALYYLFGQIAIIISNIYHTREILGLSPMHSYTSVILPLGITIDALFLLWIVYTRSKKAYLEQQNQKEFLLEQLRYVSIGQAIGGVVHQWNAPLTHIGNVATLLETTLRFDTKNLETQMQKYLPELVFNIDFMSKTSQEILGQYANKVEISEFSPKEVLKSKVLKILSSKLTLKTAHITYDIRDDLVLKMDENIFQNIMMILIDNSLDAIEKDGKINISITHQDKNIFIKYLDNCGGIQVEPIEKIFDYNFSTKNDGHGIGLAILKMLVKEKLKGDIKVENYEFGTLFTIILPR